MSTQMRSLAAGSLAVVALASGTEARAQDAEGWQGSPTAGVNLPSVPLAGEHDALAVSLNPAGLALLRGGHAAAAIDVAGSEAAAGGRGLGLYAGTSFGGGLVPRLGAGIGVERLRPLDPELGDLGDPLRLSLGGALALGEGLAIGAAYRRFSGNELLDGVGTWDLGISSRWGSHVAVGLALRDLTAPEIDGEVAQRRYELELAVRPDGTEALELGAGGRIGEDDGRLGGWLRGTLRVSQGLFLRGEYLTRELVTDVGSQRDHRLTLGFEVSFGRVGAALFGAGSRRGGESHAVGGTLIARMSGERVPAVTGAPTRIERVELGGDHEERDHGRLIARLRRLARDPAVAAVLVEIESFGGGWAVAQDIREELAAVAGAGARVYAYLGAAGLREYYLASAADRVFVDPAGGLRMTGIAGTRLYFGELLHRIGVQAQFERIAEYKSAPESYSRTGPTPEAAAMRSRIFDSVYAQIEGAIARDRGISRQRARALIEGGPYTAGDLDELDELVDAVLIPEQVERVIAKELGAAYPEGREPRTRPDRWQPPAVAVIYLNGDIVSGKSRVVPILDQRLVGDETIAEAIEGARRDPRVKAIVLRINSPGGSALASEMMAREVFKTRGVKPIICSMGDVAASGGYFAAAGCDAIFAEPTTVTGSIGIFTGKVDLSSLLSSLGLHWSVEKRGERSDMESAFRPYTEEERELILDKLRYYYDRFVRTVARGRGMAESDVEQVARGQVFTGADALKVGLVDELGGLGSAIAEARRRAGLPDDRPIRLIELPDVPLGLLGRLLGLGRADAGSGAAQLAPPSVRELLRALPGSVWAEPDAVQARLPFTLRWH